MKLYSPRHLSGLFVFLCFFLTSLSAQADIQSIRAADNEIWGSVGESLFNYKESIKPIPDSEHGWTPSIAGGLNYMGSNNWYFAVDAAYTTGKDTYSGAYLLSPSTPVKSQTQEDITTASVKFGRGYALGQSVMLTPYGELGGRFWSRDLGGGQVEDYHNFDFQLGLMGQFSPIKRLVLSGYASYGPTFGGEMKTDGVTYPLGSAGMMKLGGKVGFDLAPRWELFTTLDYDHFHYVKSPVEYDPNAGAYFLEPSSRTNETAWRVGLGYHFK